MSSRISPTLILTSYIDVANVLLDANLEMDGSDVTHRWAAEGARKASIENSFLVFKENASSLSSLQTKIAHSGVAGVMGGTLGQPRAPAKQVLESLSPLSWGAVQW